MYEPETCLSGRRKKTTRAETKVRGRLIHCEERKRVHRTGFSAASKKTRKGDQGETHEAPPPGEFFGEDTSEQRSEGVAERDDAARETLVLPSILERNHIGDCKIGRASEKAGERRGDRTGREDGNDALMIITDVRIPPPPIPAMARKMMSWMMD